MGNLFSSLTMAAESMGTFQKVLQVVSNNVTNSKTPGYAKQAVGLEALRLDFQGGLIGGVGAGVILSSRRAYLETAVHRQASQLGRLTQWMHSLEQVEAVFDITEGAGIGGAIDRLFRSFSQWSVTPNETPARQAVIRNAQEMAQAFNVAASSLGNIGAQADLELRATVNAINRIGETLRNLNVELQRNAWRLQDPGLDAQIHQALEELAEYTDFTVLRGEDGTFQISLGGQTPLVIGDRLYLVEADSSGGAPVIRDAQGKDITGQFQQGRIRALIELRSSYLPSLLGELDLLARTLADRVNAVLVEGVDRNGQTPIVDLFGYDLAKGVAATLSVTSITAGDLAAALPSAPGGNGNALNLAALGTAQELGLSTFSQYFGQIAGRLGRALSNARQDERAQSMLLSQARTVRAEATAVSLDEEAAKLIEFQRAYQAAAELARVLNSLTETVIGILR